MNMTEHILLNEALLIFLGATVEQPSYDPVGLGADRLKKGFPEKWEELEPKILDILKTTLEIEMDWKLYPWPDEAGLYVEKVLLKMYPNITKEVSRTLASYFIYHWK